MKQIPPLDSSASDWRQLLKQCDRLNFEPHDIAGHLDQRGRYEVEFDREFPLLIKLFHYTSQRHTRGPTWHERLELFLPIDGPARFRMGSQEVKLAEGDLLVVDNLKLHHVVDFPGFDTRAVVISFLPEFVYSLGSPSHDYVFLLPFYSKLQHRPHVLKKEEALAAPVHRAIAALLEGFFLEPIPQLRPIACKAYLLELLYHLARFFKSSEVLRWEFLRQQQRSLALQKLFDYISQHYGDKLSVPQAAAMVHMSPTQFMKNFKKVAGMTLVDYLNHVRLAHGVRLLKETDLSIAQIAHQTGFTDQSYFDRRFRVAFGQSPKEVRAAISKDREPRTGVPDA